MTENRQPITTAQLNALAAFQTVHGRNWKRALKAEWLRPGVANPDLQSLSQTHGLAWLDNYRGER